MNEAEMRARGLAAGDRVDITATARGARRSVRGYRTLPYDLARGSVAAYVPEMNRLIGAVDDSTHGNQPLMKHVGLRVERASERDAA